MKNKLAYILTALALLFPATLVAQGTAFTYQGHLHHAGAPATGLYEITFALYDAATSGNAIGTAITLAPVPVTNGLFTAPLDFGAAAFTGADRWLELSVTMFNSDQPVVTLTPRQPITATPYAIFAQSVSSSSVTGLLSGPVTFSNTNNSFTGDGSGLNGVSAGTLEGIPSGGFWKTTGNAGTDSATNFIGTVDAKPLKFGVNGIIAGRIYPNNLGLPSLIMGTGNYPDGSSAAGSRASVIGGGSDNKLEFGQSGFPWHAVIAGGNGNASGGRYNTIGGGQSNIVTYSGENNTIPGGRENVISGYARNSTVGGGQLNRIHGLEPASGTIAGGSANYIASAGMVYDSIAATIGGGRANTNGGYHDATIAGGSKNQIGRGFGSTIGGGSLNVIAGYQMDFATIAGGQNNHVSSALSSEPTPGITISGGFDNRAEAAYATIAGGRENRAEANYSTVAGGWNNRASGDVSFIAGGRDNVANGPAVSIGGGQANEVFADNGTVGGGYGNRIDHDSDSSSVGGGISNKIATNAYRSSISGGGYNDIGASSDSSTISGGAFNDIGAGSDSSTIGGGSNNTIGNTSLYANIAGGVLNQIATHSQSTTIGGGTYHNIASGSHWGTIAGGANNNIGTNSHSSVISGGSDNKIGSWSMGTTMAGGFMNFVDAFSHGSTLGGGEDNMIGNSSAFSVLAGGNRNDIGTNSACSAVGGGVGNSIGDNSGYSTVAGGAANDVGTNSLFGTINGGYDNNIQTNSPYATIAGGRENSAASYAFAAGRRAKANHLGSFVWGDSTDADISSDNDNSMTVRASGGLRFYTHAATISGVSLAPGSGTWSTLSDRNAKENFTPADARDVLEKVAALPMATWNYKTQGEAIRHIGPMAQDFHAAFGVGENERTITTVDADGVALTAIQGLNTKLEEQLKAKDTRIGELERRLAAMEQFLQKLATK